MEREQQRLAHMALCLACGPSGGAEEIALSLVHGNSRVDIPVSAVTSINVWASTVYRNSETGSEFESGRPVVEVCLTDPIKQSICELSRRLLQKPMEIWVTCRIISRPIVREPLCTSHCFDIGIADVAEGDRLAAELKSYPKLACH
jgi:preprotein translocase subunit SecD